MKTITGKNLLSLVLILIGTVSFAQVKIGTNPTTIAPTSNLEVEASDGNKVIINKAVGTVQIDNLPSGIETDSLVTVGADGILKQSNVLNIKRILGISGSARMTRTTVQAMPQGTTMVDFTASPIDEEGAVDLSGDYFSIKRAGLYTISTVVTGRAGGTSGAGAFRTIVRKQLPGTSTWESVGVVLTELNAGSQIPSVVTFLDYLDVNDKLSVWVQPCSGCDAGQNGYTIRDASFTILKNL